MTIADKLEVHLNKTQKSTMWRNLQDISAAQDVKLNTLVIHASLKILPIEAGRVIASNQSHLSLVDRRRSCRQRGLLGLRAELSVFWQIRMQQ